MAEPRARRLGRRSPAVALGAWAMAVLVVTLRPVAVPPNPASLSFWCLACGDRGVADAILNWVVFVPGGVFAAHLIGGRRAVWAAVLGSVGLEFLQSMIPGRYPSLSDIVFNGAGALAGVLLTRPSSFGPFRVAAAVAAATAWLSPLALLAPVAPGPVVYGQWSPVIGGMGRYEGEVLDARADGLLLPSWRLDDPDLVRALRDPMRLDLRVRVGATPEGIAPVFSVADERGFRLLVVAAEGTDLAVHRRALASALRLEQPLVWFEGALAGVAVGEAADLAVTRGGEGTCIEAPGRRGCAPAPGLERGWQFLFGSFWRPGPASVALSALWCLVLGGLVGMGAGSPRRGLLAGAALGASGHLAAVIAGPQTGAGLVWMGLLGVGGGLGGLASGRLGRWLRTGGLHIQPCGATGHA